MLADTRYEHLLVEVADGVATFVLNRPDRLNALNQRLGIELLQAVAACAEEPLVRALVLTGAGRAFCAGDDLRDPEGFSAGRRRDRDTAVQYVSAAGRWPAIVLALRALPKPVIAMVNGFAYGAGLNLALACDFRFAAESATLAAPFVLRGMATGTNLLQQYTSIGVAAQMVLTGEPLAAPEAHRLGLVTRVFGGNRLEQETAAFARQMARSATAALGLTKAALYRGWNEDPQRAYELQGYAVHLSGLTEDRAEGQQAFLEHRPPRFEGR
ncbi:MAG: enoyl-CoA hydratase/isomerase family protein [Dehalococcoidia bacterium]